MSCVTPCMKQPHAWTFHVIHTRGREYNYAWWLLLFYASLSSSNSSMNVLHFYKVLAQYHTLKLLSSLLRSSDVIVVHTIKNINF